MKKHAEKLKPATGAGFRSGSGRQDSVKRVILLYSNKLQLEAQSVHLLVRNFLKSLLLHKDNHFA